MYKKSQFSYLAFTWRILFLGIAAPIFSFAAIPAPTKTPAWVSVEEVKSVDLGDALVYPARVSPKVNTVVLAESDGIVTEIRTPLGQAVKPKEKLVQIQHTDPIYQYAPVWVKAPIKGMVSSLEVDPGSAVVRGQKLLTVTDPEQVRILIEVPAGDLNWIRRGLKGEFRLISKNIQVPVEVHGVSPFVDPTTGTATCELTTLGKVSFGLLGQVVFQVNPRKGVSIPEESIVYRGKETFVRVLREEKAYKVPVKLGSRAHGRFEVLEGLQPGASVVGRSSRFLADGDPVQIQKSETPEAEVKTQ